MEYNNFWFAISLTIFAGLSTGIGSAIAFFAKRTQIKLLAVSLGFSAGVMIYVSFIEIFYKGKNALVEALGMVQGSWVTVAAFFGGILAIALIDKLVPSFENPHEMHNIEELSDQNKMLQFRKLFRMGIFSAIAIAIHNFPEGLATFIVALKDPKFGVPIAIAIAIHNIPEGMAVSIPIFYSTGKKSKAFWLSFLSGMAEPVGALIGFLIFYRFMNDVFFGIIFAFVAGIMVFISFDQLLPSAEKYGEHHYVIYGLIAGMAVMSISLLLFL